MKSATASNRKISWLHRESDAGSLDLSPAFQRRPVWSPEQSAYLIDTILNGLPFPEIYIRSSTSADGATRYEVVDGQQRIRSILEFARNDLELLGNDVSAKYYGKSFEDLSEDERKAFWGYDVVTRELHEASDGDIRDLFRRLNINAVNLNDQELRHARYTGAFITTMEKLADDPWWLERGVVSLRQIRRMEDVEFVSELFIALMAGPQDKKTRIDEYYCDYDSTFPDRHVWVERFVRTRDLIPNLLPEEEVRHWSGKSDFYTLFHVFGTYVERRTRWTEAQRMNVAKTLATFRKQVALAKRKDNTQRFAGYVHEYADAVARAASDVARRQLRSQIVLERVDRARALPSK